MCLLFLWKKLNRFFGQPNTCSLLRQRKWNRVITIQVQQIQRGRNYCICWTKEHFPEFEDNKVLSKGQTLAEHLPWAEHCANGSWCCYECCLTRSDTVTDELPRGREAQLAWEWYSSGLTRPHLLQPQPLARRSDDTLCGMGGASFHRLPLSLLVCLSQDSDTFVWVVQCGQHQRDGSWAQVLKRAGEGAIQK